MIAGAATGDQQDEEEGAHGTSYQRGSGVAGGRGSDRHVIVSLRGLRRGASARHNLVMTQRVLLIASLLMIAPACGKKDKDAGGGKGEPAAAGKLAGGCDRRANEHLCGEYHGAVATPDWVKEQCDAMKAPFVEACPKEGAVGRCLGEGGTETLFYAPFTKESVADMCKPPMKLVEP